MPPEAETQTEQKPAEGAPPPEKTLTQSEVNAILARERSNLERKFNERIAALEPQARRAAELEEAARMDGCGRYPTFYRIVLPIARPGLLAGSIMAMMSVWNDFLIGFTLAVSEQKRLLPYGLFAYISNIGVDWGQLMAATVLALLPVVFAFLIMQKWLVQGLMAGAVKG